jgi:tetratricopeptide (TPR) repeat protein
LTYLDAAARENPNQPDYFYQKGNSFAAMSKMEEAVRQYDAALKINPAHVDALNNKGNALAAQNKFPEALVAFDAALKAAPNAANSYFNRGMVRNTLGDKSGACADWQKAAQMGYAQAQSIIGQLCR